MSANENGGGKRPSESRHEEMRRIREEMGELPSIDGGAATSRTSEECRDAWSRGLPWMEDDRARRFLVEDRGLDVAMIPADAARVVERWRVSAQALPAHSLVYPLRSVATGELIGLQVRRFDVNGALITKPAKSVASGRKAGAAVMLGPREALNVILVDGQEDALAVWQAIGGEASGQAVWATTSVAFGGDRWPVVDGRVFTFLCDGGSEEEKGRAAAERMADAGHLVFVAPPPSGLFPDGFRIVAKAGQPFKDANDAVLAGQPQAIMDALRAARPVRGGQVRELLPADAEARPERALKPLFANFYVREWPNGYADIAVCDGGAAKGADPGVVSPLRFLCAYLQIESTMASDLGDDVRCVLRFSQWRYVVPMAELLIDPARVFAQRGIAFNVNLVPSLKMFIQRSASMAPRRLDANRAGYADGGGYLAVDGDYVGPTRPDQPIFEPPKEWRRAGSSGTLKGWQCGIARPALKSPHALLSLGIAFASALVRPLRLKNAGILWIGESGSGKSTFLYIAASLIGSPEVFAPPAKASEPAFYNLAYKLSDHPLIFDEMEDGLGSEKAMQILSYMSYGHSNGASPGRVDRETMENRDVKYWHSTLQVSGEIDPAGIAARYGNEVRGGAEGRLLNLKVRRKRGAYGERYSLEALEGIDDLRDEIEGALQTEYGTAWKPFVRYVMGRSVNGLRRRFRGIQAEMLERVGFDKLNDTGNIKRAVALFSLARLGLELSFDAGVLPPDGRSVECGNGIPILDVPYHFLELWIEQRGGKAPREAMLVRDTLRRWVAENGHKCGRLDVNGAIVGEVENRTLLAFMTASYYGDDDSVQSVDNDPRSRILWIDDAALVGVVFGKSSMPHGLIRAILRDMGVVDGEMDSGKWRFSSQAPRSLRRATGRKRLVRLDLVKLENV